MTERRTAATGRLRVGRGRWEIERAAQKSQAPQSHNPIYRNPVSVEADLPGQGVPRYVPQGDTNPGPTDRDPPSRLGPGPGLTNVARTWIGMELITICYAIVLPGRKTNFRASFRPDSNWESLKIGPPAGRRPAGGPILRLSRLESGRNPARKPDSRPGSTIA